MLDLPPSATVAEAVATIEAQRDPRVEALREVAVALQQALVRFQEVNDLPAGGVIDDASGLVLEMVDLDLMGLMSHGLTAQQQHRRGQ